MQNVNTNKSRFDTMIHTFLTKLFPEDALEDQKEYLESARCQGDITPENYIKWIMHINKCLLFVKLAQQTIQRKSWSKRSLLETSRVKFKLNSFQNEGVEKQTWTKSRVSSIIAQRQSQFKKNKQIQKVTEQGQVRQEKRRPKKRQRKGRQNQLKAKPMNKV